MKLHLLSLPHTQVTAEYLSCAYTQKVLKFCKMMGKDYEIILYGGDQSEAENVSELVECVKETERAGWFGKGFNTVTGPLKWDPSLPYWQAYAERAIPAIRKRAERRDLLLVIGGNCQKPITDQVPELHPCEWGVGYEGIYTAQCAFESAAWMHHVYGLQKTVNGRAFDAVIPNFFDRADFQPLTEPGRKRDTLLFLGRVTKRKGVEEAGVIAKRLGMKFVVAGPGATQCWPGDEILGDGCHIPAGDVEYVGEVGKERRAELLANAACLMVPTRYIEPFGGVAVEAMMSGCPVVATDWGAFTETVTPDVGRRFRTIAQGVEAVREAMTLDRAAIAEAAIGRYSLEAVRPQFKKWFEQIWTLWGEGFYA